MSTPSLVKYESIYQALKSSRKEYLHIKTNTINEISKHISSSNSSINECSSDDLKSIDQHIEALSSIITTSVNIATSIITPVKDKEQILTNITKTIDAITTEKSLKELLTKLESEVSLENKIQIILQANTFIHTNPDIFASYKKQFMQKGLDVLAYLNNHYNTLKSKVKDDENVLNEIDKNIVLTYKLSSDINILIEYFDFLASFVNESACPQNLLCKLYGDIELLKTNNDIKREQIKEMFQTTKVFIQKILMRISHTLQEKQSTYINLSFTSEPIFYLLISRIIKGTEQTITDLLNKIITLSHFSESSNELTDLICSNCSFILSSCEKFKFFLITLSHKVKHFYHYTTTSNDKDNLDMFLINFESMLYSIGEQYCNNEIKFMKDKILSLFEDESKTYLSLLEEHIEDSYDELSGCTLTCIEDAFYILKMSGGRAISTLNLQMAFAIINNIKIILDSDLYSLLDMKTSAILVKTEYRTNQSDNTITTVKYKCNSEPTLNYKFNYGNLFLICCLNSIDQTKENIHLLLNELNAMLNNEIVQSQIFDSNQIQLNIDNDNTSKMKNVPVIEYFKPNELEIINITFSDKGLILQKYEDFIHKKVKLAFEYLNNKINSSVDILNSINYVIDQSNIATAEMSGSFSGLFIEETNKLLNQWQTQLSENGFKIFMEHYVEYVVSYMEKILKRKNYSSYGTVILQKDLIKISNYFQEKVLIEIREKFERLFAIEKVLNFESDDELKEYLDKYDDIKLKSEEITNIRSLKNIKK